MDYENYSVADFVLDDSFRCWVKSPDPETEAFWEIWVANHPHKKETVDEARYLLVTVLFREYDLSDESYERLKYTVTVAKEDFHQSKTTPLPTSVRFIPVWGQRIAAILVLGVLLMGIASVFLSDFWGRTKYRTQYGQTRTLMLPDGSTAVLNANSTLTIAKDWNDQTQREVWLEGEAFFRVSKKSSAGAGNAKFVVHTDYVDVEVLGTQFDVKHRRDKTQVILKEGRVRLNDPSGRRDQVIMAPGDFVELSAENQIAQRKVNPALYTAWQEKRLVFQETSLAEIALLLEDNYGMRVEFEDPVMTSLQFTGSFPTQDVDYMLRILSKTFNIQMSKERNRIIIHNKP